MNREWIVPPVAPERAGLADRLNVSPLIAQILLNRGITDSASANTFLRPRRDAMSSPDAMPGAVAAAERIVQAVRAKQRILIYGDYDVDGVTGCAILWRLLRLADAEVEVYIPHRLEEGYGLNADAVRKLVERGAQLIVTVDCGVTAVEEVALARSLGADIIVTDHHDIGGAAPEATVVVHPGLGDDASLHDLCGAAVAFKLAWAVARCLNDNAEKVSDAYREFLVDAMGLVALGTIADVVPLTGENRILARFGLEGLRISNNHGIQALLESAGLTGQAVDSQAVGFKLGPRLNAAGRMGHARLALELLTRADAGRAREIAIYLEEQNRKRQSVERKIAQQARELIAATGADADNRRAIVLAREGWHAGVVGIVASRIVEEFHRPTILIAIENGFGQGSGRSIRNFHLSEALTACRDHLVSFGGHAMAGGLSLETDRLDAFTAQFVDHANGQLTSADLVPKLRLDAVATLADMARETVVQLANLGPFGMGNPRPKFQADGLELAGEPRCVGASSSHLQFAVRQNGCSIKAIGFGLAEREQMLRDHRRVDIAFEPILNTFRGVTNVEMRVIDFRPSLCGDAEPAQAMLC